MSSISFLIRKEGDSMLRQKAWAVSKIASSDIRHTIRLMRHAMEDAAGIGIAAPQIGKSLRIFLVANFSHNPHASGRPKAQKAEHPLIYINPVILAASGKLLPLEEGCLSIPNVRGIVPRRERVTLEASDETGRRFRVEATGLLAHVFQHEADHLDGILFPDKAIEIIKKDGE